MGRAVPRKKKANVILSDDEERDDTPFTKAASPKKPKNGVKKTAAPKVGTPQSSKSTRSRKDGLASPASQASQSPSGKQKAERTLFSFFNKQTQRQQSLPNTNGHVKQEESIEVADDDIDIIEDDDSMDEALAALGETTFGSKYPVPVRAKRKMEEVNGSDSGMPKASQLFKRVATEMTRPPPMLDQRPWTERFGPVNFEELAVHKKKVQDVRSWLHNVISGRDRKRLLVLKGSAGAGKTITVKLVSEALGIQISEWTTSGATTSEEGLVSMSGQFQDFVARTGTFGMLDFGSTDSLPSKKAPSPHEASERKQLILIEEFPNTFSRSSSGLQSFRSAVMTYLEASTPSLGSMLASQAASRKPIVPIVMIISESLLSTSTASSDSFTAYRLLGPDILSHAGTTVIEFNPVAPTFMIKALDLVLQKESKKSGRRRAPGPAVLKHLAGIGDIRSAVSSLEFLCLRGDEASDQWTGRVTFNKKSAKKGEVKMSTMEAESLQMVTQRESTLGIFHAVGKVVYNKREAPSATDTPPPQPPNHMPQHARPRPSEVDIEALLNELGTDISTFVAALHENYILSTAGIDAEETLDHVNGCIDALSCADVLSPDRFGTTQFAQTYAGTGTDSLRQDEISFQVSVRGILFSLPSPVKRLPLPPQLNGQRFSTGTASFGGKGAAYQMFYPASARLWRRREETEESLDTLLSKLRNRAPSAKTSSSDLSKSSNMNAVEAWRMNRFGGQATSGYLPDQMTSTPHHEEDEEIDFSTLSLRSSLFKGEMLLERLPYMSVMRKAHKIKDLQDLGKELDKVIRMSAGPIVVAGDGDEEGEDAENAEQWSTDKPANENVAKRGFGIRKSSTKSDNDVKGKLQSLVLEDDDIEDSE